MDIWSRPWVPWLPSGIPQAAFNPRTPNLISHPLDFTKVQELFIPGTRCWNVELLFRLFDLVSTEAVSWTQPLPGDMNDMVVWRGTKSGQFDVKSAYRVSMGACLEERHDVWTKLRKSPLHFRLRLLL